jgi:hypothetical protein
LGTKCLLDLFAQGLRHSAFSGPMQAVVTLAGGGICVGELDDWGCGSEKNPIGEVAGIINVKNSLSD